MRQRPDQPQDFSSRVPDGDTRARQVCNTCGFIHYDNPKIVVGAVVRAGEKILLCRRAIEPRRGLWTIPAGFLELHESAEDGARREAWEEARAELEIDRLLAVYSIPRISQVQLIFRARLAAPGFAAGPESSEVALFAWDDVPWRDLAFPSVHWALRQSRSVWNAEDFAVFANPPGQTGDEHL
ncbi:MAG: NUDIX domain-containing protein [Alphaproteobacteria bacterium]|nr:MAG: NUDIX domain-containing protein [Alphaproteobacteria bacterium]